MKPPNLAQFRLPSTSALGGLQFRLPLTAGGAVNLAFSANGKADWHASGVPWAGNGSDPYDAVEVVPKVFFIDIDFETRPLEALTLLLAPGRGHALLVHQSRTPRANPAVAQTFLATSIDGVAPVGPAPAPTTDLTGRWHRMHYSPENLYEHIYVSNSRMFSHNLRTQNTSGRADCHDASYWRFSENLYLVGWREKDSEAGMIMCEDLGTRRATGKVLHPMSNDRSGSAPIGGYIYPAEIKQTITARSDAQ
jgi:hypothetical protein